MTSNPILEEWMDSGPFAQLGKAWYQILQKVWWSWLDFWKFHTKLYKHLTTYSWWLNQPIWKIWVKLDHFPRDPGWHLKKYLKRLGDWTGYPNHSPTIWLHAIRWHRTNSRSGPPKNGVFKLTTHRPHFSKPTSHVGIPARSSKQVFESRR